MTRSTRFALLAGATLAALTVAGCQQDDAVSGPLSARAAHAAPGGAPASPSAVPAKPPADDPSRTLQFTDSWGHVYGVAYSADGSSTHTLDGTAYAQVLPLAGGDNVQYLGSGGFVMQQFMAGAAPSGLPSAFERERPPLHGGGRPQQMQLIPCADQIAFYIAASGALVAAGYGLRSGANARTTMIFTGALTTWWKAWNSLYDCENAIGLTTAVVIPR